ncbi:putative ATP-dependent RNA helicase DDX60 isoform X3 [Ascaphus truei]|uniref:putative ATP-dependent RNA helicase DDX60 isoform X3 n=1 Tax=Ascaphus truei TaxID=8439 RepID=UPI003F59030A
MASGGFDPGKGIDLINSDKSYEDTELSNERPTTGSLKSNNRDTPDISSEDVMRIQVSVEQEEHAGFLDKMSLFVMEQLSRAKFASLLNDYVESEFFLIDGDSLLITCITDETLKTGQNLHFFFLIESLLLRLTNKGAKYDVVFFKDMENLYFSRPDLISLRTQLKLHLEQNTDTVVYDLFSNFLSPEWKKFLHDKCPYFLMASDEGMSVPGTYFLHLLILNALGNNINVVLFSGQEFDHLRVYGYHVKIKNHQKHYVRENESNITAGLQALVASAKTSHEAASLSFFQHFHSETMDKEISKSINLLSHLWTEGSDIRHIVCVVSCSIALRIYAEMSKFQNQKQDDSDVLTLDEVADLCKMYCLSVAFLLILPLSQRAQGRTIHAAWNTHVLAFIEMQKRCEHMTLNQVTKISKMSNWKVDWTHLPDLSDDLLLKNIAYYYENEDCTDFKLEFGNEIDLKYKYLWNSVLQLDPQGEGMNSYHLRTTSKPFLSKESSFNGNKEKIPTVGLIPMQSDIIKDYAGDIIKELPFLSSNDPVVTSLTPKKSYDELRHWHSGRPLSDDYDRTRRFEFNGTEKDPRGLRQYQKLQTFQRFYGQSLGINASKKITVQMDQSEKKSLVDKAIVNKKEPHMTKKEKIKEENRKRIKAKDENKEIEQWNSMASSFEKELKDTFVPGIKRLEEFVKTVQTHSVKFLVELTTLNTCVEVWLEQCKTHTKEQRDINIAVEIMKKIQTILSKHQEMLQRKDQKKIAKYLKYLGFENLARSLKSSKETNVEDEKREIKYSVGVGSARFQMQYMGPYLLREERTDPDPRVQHFIPDTWQRELLDVVDNNESAVIVAPTSSGKTYASYYCMEKILKEGNEGVVVYVAPTKALVNQVVATVSDQFTKDMPNGIALCGVFTRDYRTDALNSQILVTVPQCLEILMLSPCRQEWVKRIRYIIFDEVHCLGGEIGAEVWEHLLVMIRCPFLALSATISNPEHLTEWLQSVKQNWQDSDEITESSNSSNVPKKGRQHKAAKTEKKSYRVRLVLYEERYNDLEKYVCSAQDSSISFEHYHPCAALTVDHIAKYGIPSDLTFSSRESIQLYDAMVRAWPEWSKIKELDPEEYIHFKDKIIITKCDARKYEKELKKELTNWTEKGLQREVQQVLRHLQPFELSNDIDYRTHVPLLVEKLKENDKLPAIFFVFHLNLVEHLPNILASSLCKKHQERETQLTEKEVQKLCTRETKIRKSIKRTLECKSKKWRQSGRRQRRDLQLPGGSRMSQQDSERDRSSNTSFIDNDDTMLIDVANLRSIQQKLKKSNAISPECTYADNKAVSHETLMEVFFKTRNSRKSENLQFLALKGIGYHHSSLDSKGMTLVEMLFRMGFIKVVTATGTLALGINMPCKSVVFMHDSVYLDALNYRQMSGRAGRRGQDLLGSVFFFNVPMPKVKKLMKSNVPELKGQFPLSISLVLRLMLLAAKAEDKEDAKAKVLSILKHSMMSFKQPCETQMLKMFFLFSLHFLIHEGYLDQECNPMGFTGLASHLHYHEPSNFVFVSFLEKGLFHQLCQTDSTDSKRFPDSVMTKLVLVLANLFGRRYLPPSMLKFKGTFCQSKVFLDNLPHNFAIALEDHNKKTAIMFGHCLLTVSKLANMEQEYQLPLSHINFSGKECKDSELVNHLMNCTEGRTAISPFACLSGNTDHKLLKGANVNSLLMQTSYINTNAIPILHLEKEDDCGRRILLNAYVLDFFKHGSMDAITRDNCIHEGDAYMLLKDFVLAVAAISVSLKELCEDENDTVVLAFEQLSTMFIKKLNAV